MKEIDIFEVLYIMNRKINTKKNNVYQITRSNDNTKISYVDNKIEKEEN